MSLYSFYRISKPSEDKVPAPKIESEYKKLRSQTFWGVTAAYSLYYICRMALSVVKQPLIDDGILTAGELGIIGSSLSFVYAIGKFTNGFIADYCNIRRFMATGLVISSLINLVMGSLGLLHGCFGFSTVILFCMFSLLWGINGWAQSMGAPPGVISLSRWFPLSSRGTFYSIFCATPYLGKFVSIVLTGHIVVWIGWQWGFILASIVGLIGAVIVLIFVSDTPESKGLPSVQTLSGEETMKTDNMPTKTLQKAVLRHPGIWIIAISSAFVYITQFGLSNWGILFLQKSKSFSLTEAAWIIGFSEAFGIAGTILAGWLSDRIFKGNRIKPVLTSGIICLISLTAFLATKGNTFMNILYIAVFSLSIGVLYCIIAGLMALDIVPRKATGAALGVVGISSYVAVGLQDIVSGFLIQGNSSAGSSDYDFTSVAIFWIISCIISFILPLVFWRQMQKKVIKD